MEHLITLVNQPGSMGVIILVCLYFLNRDVKAVKKSIKDIHKHCNGQAKWCLDHFQPKE